MKNLVSFKQMYNNIYENLNESSEAAAFWLGNFLMLFFMPVVYPVLWVYFKIKE